MRNMAKKIFLSLSLLWVGRTFSNVVTEGAVWIKNLYSSSLSKVEHTIGMPQKSLQIGLPATAVVGLLGYLACPSEDLQKIRDCLPVAKWLGLGSATLCGAYGLQWAKRWWRFYCIEKSLHDASFLETAHGNKFRYATWKKNRWALAADLLKHKNDVKKQLKHDITACSDQAYDNNGNNIDHTVKITSSDVKKWINNELKKLKKDLCDVGSCTDAHEGVIEFLIMHEQRTSNNISDFINIAENVAFLHTLNKEQLKALKNRIKNHTARPNFKKIVYFPGHQFWNIRFAPHYRRATKLYYKLLRHYIRLSALKSIADEMSWTVDPTKQKPPQYNVVFENGETE